MFSAICVTLLYHIFTENRSSLAHPWFINSCCKGPRLVTGHFSNTRTVLLSCCIAATFGLNPHLLKIMEPYPVFLYQNNSYADEGSGYLLKVGHCDLLYINAMVDGGWIIHITFILCVAMEIRILLRPKCHIQDECTLCGGRTQRKWGKAQD